MPKQRPKPRHAPKKRSASPSKTTAIVPAVPIAQIRREYNLKQEQIDLIRSTICRNATNEELQLFLWVAKKHRLDPLTRQLHAVKRNVTKHHQDEKGIWCSGEVMTIQVGIDGYRAMAARYKDYGGIDEPEYQFAKTGDKIPTMARVRVWKKGFDHPSIGIAYWDEYAPNLDLPTSFMWSKMPKHMLAKCAEALALRRAYPELSDLYTDEEMAQHDQDFTAGGRQIVTQDGTAPSGRTVTWEAQHRGQLSETAAHGHAPGSEKARQAEETLRRVEAEDEALRQARTVVPKAATTTPTEKAPEKPVSAFAGPILEAEAVGPDRFRVMGDIQDTYPMIEHYCTLEDGFWFTNLAKLEEMRGLQEKFKFRLTVVPSAKPTGKGPAEKKATAPASGSQTPVSPTVVSGTLLKSIAGMTSSNKPVRDCTISVTDAKGKTTKPTYRTFNKHWFEVLDQGVGKEGVFILTQNGTYTNLTAVRKLGGKEWDEQGVAVIQNSTREAGQKTLYP